MDLTKHIQTCFDTLCKYRDFYDNEICFEQISENEFMIPNELNKSITPDRNKSYIEVLLSSLDGYNGDMDLHDMGNILKWTFFTDFTESELLDEHGIGLIVKCEYPFQVGCVIGTSCNDILIEILYDNIDDYLVDYNKWKTLPTPTKDDLTEAKDFIETYNLNTPVDRKFIANKVTTFYEYILIIKDQLPIGIEYKPIEDEE